MDKKAIYIGAIVGSIIGGYLPTLFGASYFSFSSVLLSGLGAILGIWIMFKLLR